MRKLVLIAFLAICLASCVKSNVLSELVNDGIYEAIDGVVKVKYSDKPKEEQECISKKFRDDKVAEKFYTRDLLFNHKKLEQELEPYFSNTELFCEWWVFAKTPLGICCLIGIAIMLLSLIIGICSCCCRLCCK